jgi:hypothetical protein
MITLRVGLTINLMALALIPWLSGCAPRLVQAQAHAHEIGVVARQCVKAQLDAGWMDCSIFEQYAIRFSFWTHADVPFWGVRFNDAVHVLDSDKPIFGCWSAKPSGHAVEIWRSRGWSREKRRVAEADWTFESYSLDQWHEFSQGPDTIEVDGKSPKELGIGSLCPVVR